MLSSVETHLSKDWRQSVAKVTIYDFIRSIVGATFFAGLVVKLGTLSNDDGGLYYGYRKSISHFRR